MEQIFNETISELLTRYLMAFTNLYSSISIKRALRIIRQQNPELEIDEDDFYDFVSEHTEKDGTYCFIEYESVMLGAEIPTEKDRMLQLILQDYLEYDDPDEYRERADYQDGLKYYVPEKSELLKFADFDYIEPTEAIEKMKEFLRSLNVADEYTDEIICEIHDFLKASENFEEEIDDINTDIARFGKSIYKKLMSQKYIDTYFELLNGIRNDTRRHLLHGFKPRELNISLEN